MTDVELAQINLQRRLKSYKENKRKMEVEKTDYTEDIKNIDNKFAELKSEIIIKLTNASTHEEYNLLSNVVNYRLSFLVKDIEDFKNNVNTKDFTSKTQAQNLIDGIILRINNLQNILNKEEN